MKLPVPGFVSQALSSLINNDHRVKRAPFDKSKTSRRNKKLEFKKVSEEERKRILDEILYRRKQRFLVGALIVCGILLLFLVFIAFS